MEFRFKNRNLVYEAAAFGLPVVHRRGSKVIKAKLVKNHYSISFERRSSPLFFKILRSRDEYYWIVGRFAGEFLPEGSVIVANGSQKPDYRLIDEFWDEAKQYGHEYILSLPDSLRALIEEMKTKLSPKALKLFGSRARGDFHRNSDIDIAVDTEENIEAHDFNGAVDIINMKTMSSDLKEVVDREGVSLL